MIFGVLNAQSGHGCGPFGAPREGKCAKWQPSAVLMKRLESGPQVAFPKAEPRAARLETAAASSTTMGEHAGT